jgi:hypothetical protein
MGRGAECSDKPNDWVPANDPLGRRRSSIGGAALLDGTGSWHNKRMTKLIPREVLFGNPERLSPQLSPDGRHLAYIAPDDRNVLQVWVQSPGQAQAKKITADGKRGIRSFFWTYQADRLIYLQDADGDENFHLYLVNVVAGEVRDLTPFSGVRAQPVATEPSVPDAILVGLNRTDPRKHDVYRISLTEDSVELEAENPGHVIGWTADSCLKVRAALAATPDGGHEVWVRAAGETAWTTLLVLGPDDQGGPVDFSADGQTLYLLSSADANAQRLLAWNLLLNRPAVLAEDPEYDVSGVFVHPTRRTVQAVAFYKEKLSWLVLDPEIKKDFETLAAIRPGEVHVSHGDLADQQWLVTYVVDDGPVLYYRITGTTGRRGRQSFYLASVPRWKACPSRRCSRSPSKPATASRCMAT